MFKRRWKWLGKLSSGEGFTLAYANRGVTYSDERGSFQFGFEDGFLFPTPFQISGEPVSLTPSQIDEMLERITEGIRSEGHAVEIYRAKE